MTRLSIEVNPGEIIRVMGPLRVYVAKGRVMVLGAVFGEGESFEVNTYRSYGIKALDEPAVINVVLGEGASIEQPRPSEEVLDTWVKVGDEIVSRLESGDSVVVLGPTDAGKSSFVALLANRALHASKRVVVVDSDIGQADVGPPGFVSGAFVRERILWLREVKAEQLRFIGSITPSRFEKRILSAVVDLYDWGVREGADVVLIDTDGWIYGLNALDYKLELIRIVRPRAVVVIGDEILARVVEKVVKSNAISVYYAPSPAVARIRDREDRRQLRSQAYKRFFENAQVREIELSSIAVFGSCFLMGQPLAENKLSEFSRELGVEVVAGSEGIDYIMLIVTKHPRSSVVERLSAEKQVYISVAGEEKGLYLAVLGPDLREKAPGVLQELDYKNLRAKIYTAYEGEIGGLVFGSVKLSLESGFEEMGRVQRCTI